MKIAWAKIAKSAQTPDYSTPESVVYGFILAMHDWEAAAAKLDKSKRTEADKRRELKSMNQIFARYCTLKKRPYGRLGSYQIPPEYDPKEALIDVTYKTKTRAELTTRSKKEGCDYLYVVLKKDGAWRIDSKKIRDAGGSWLQWTL